MKFSTPREILSCTTEFKGDQQLHGRSIPPHMFRTVYGNGMAVVAIRNKLYNFRLTGLEHIVEVPDEDQLLFQWFFLGNTLCVYSNQQIFTVSDSGDLKGYKPFVRKSRPYFIQHKAKLVVLFDNSN